MLRALQGRWPYRRSHSRHDHHWLLTGRAQAACRSVREHSRAHLPAPLRRPHGD
jgi:hypothetical protein